MYNVKIDRKIISTNNKTYAEARAKAFILSRKYPGQKLLIDQKIMTDSGIDLGWDNIGSIRAVW